MSRKKEEGRVSDIDDYAACIDCTAKRIVANGGGERSMYDNGQFNTRLWICRVR